MYDARTLVCDFRQVLVLEFRAFQVFLACFSMLRNLRQSNKPDGLGAFKHDFKHSISACPPTLFCRLPPSRSRSIAAAADGLLLLFHILPRNRVREKQSQTYTPTPTTRLLFAQGGAAFGLPKASNAPSVSIGTTIPARLGNQCVTDLHAMSSVNSVSHEHQRRDRQMTY